MRDRLQTLLGIEPHEWRRFSAFALYGFLVAVGIEFGRIGRDSYVLTTVGVEAIPLMYVLIAVLMVAAAPLYDRLVHGVSPDRLMIGFQVFGGLTLLLLWTGVSLPSTPSPWLPYLVFPWVEAFLLYLLIHFWKFANVGFDARAGKRLFPFIGGAALFGSLVGGISSRFLSGMIGAEHLFALWSVCLLATIPLTRTLRTLTLEEGAHAIDDEPPEEGGVAAVPLQAIRQVFAQPLLRTLTYMALPMWIIIYIIEYSYFGVAERVFLDQDALAGFLGSIVALAAGIGLLLQFSVTPWLLRRFGVGTTYTVYPATLTLGAVALLTFSLFPGSTAPSLPLGGIALLAVFARLCDVAFFFSIQDSALQLLYYAVPEELRDRARVLMSAIVVPVSMACAGALLMLFAQRQEPEHNLAFVGVALAFLLMVFAMSVTPEYLGALLSYLRPEDVEHRNEVLGEIAKLEDNDARYVLLQSLSTDDIAEARFALDRLFQIQDAELIPDLLESGSQMRKEVLMDIERRMSDEDRLVHADALERALKNPRIPAPA